MPFDAGQEGAAIGVDEGTTTVDEVLELDTTDRLELGAPDEESVAELDRIVDVLKEVMDGVVLELEALELLETDVEAVLAVVVALAVVTTELEVVVVIGRI